MLISALVRSVSAAGGFATVVRIGDRDAGAILIQCMEKGENPVLLEQRNSLSGATEWAVSGDGTGSGLDANDLYIARRIRSDPDIWIIELDIAGAAQFAVECIGAA